MDGEVRKPVKECPNCGHDVLYRNDLNRGTHEIVRCRKCGYSGTHPTGKEPWGLTEHSCPRCGSNRWWIGDGPATAVSVPIECQDCGCIYDSKVREDGRT